MKKFISFNDKKISRIGLGTSGIGGYFSKKKFDDSCQNNFLNFFSEAYDLGLRFIDTAESYASGESEKIVGMIPNVKKDNLFITSKFNFTNTSFYKIEKSLDNSLLRLRRDYLDLYMPHWPYPGMNIDALIEVLIKLKDKGKIKHLGLSNFDNYYNDLKCVDEIGFYESELNPYFTSSQKNFFEYFKQKNCFFIGYAPFKQGIVFNKNSKIYNHFVKVFNDYSISLSQYILIWMLSFSDRIIVIPKTENIDRLKEFVNIFSLPTDVIEDVLNSVKKLDLSKSELIDVKSITMKKDSDRPVYYSLDEAIKNSFKLHPNVLDIANEIKINNGNLTKPVRLMRNENKDNYNCVDGRLKYWAWVYLYGNQSKIPSVVY